MKRLLAKCKHILIMVLMISFRIFPIKNNKIMIVSFYGKGYGDSSKYICNYLLSHYPKVDIVWACNESYFNSLPVGVRFVKYNSFKYFYELSTAKIWIDNSRKNYYILKRKKQFYIQTWHSSLRLKKIERDAVDYLPKEYIKNAVSDSKKINAIIAGCEFSYNTYNNSFWYNGNILKVGTPRCDILFDKDEQSKLYDDIVLRYKIPKNKKLILYAPTFRKNNPEFRGNIKYQNFISNLGDDYILLVRFHPNSKMTLEEKDNIKNVTSYPDMQELISVVDILITDYSGCCFDMGIARKKCILFVPDLDEYLSSERSLYFDFSDLPFPKVKNESELIDAIKNWDDDEYLKKLEYFLANIGSYEDGKASERVANIIMEVIRNGKKI